MPVERERLAQRALRIAPRLVGALIVSDVGGVRVAVRLSEVEAYEGMDDPASHAFRGSTRRSAIMFGPPGHLYCYFTYGMHWCANVVCGLDGIASAVLLRAGRVVEGLEHARERRPSAKRDADLARGPARLASCLSLGAAQNGLDLCAIESEVRLEEMPQRRSAHLEVGPRVGINVANERPWRFWRRGDPTVSAFTAGTRNRVRSSPAN